MTVKTATAIETLNANIAKIVKQGSLLGSKSHEGFDGQVNRLAWDRCMTRIAAMFDLAAELGILTIGQAADAKREAHNKMIRNFDRNYTNRNKRQQNAA